MWRGVLLTTTGLGKRRKLPIGVWDGAPAEDGFCAYLRSERSHVEPFLPREA